MSGFNSFIKRKFNNFFGCGKLGTLLCQLQNVAKILIFLATVGLFLFALVFPHFWIILILFLLFLGLLALVCD